MYTGITPINPLAAPGTVTRDGSLAEQNPLPPPGNPVDCSTDDHPHAYGLYPAQLHTFELVFGGTITEGQVWSLTFTPTKMINGSVQAAALDAITIPVTVNATATDEALAIQFAAAIAASGTMAALSLADLTRINEILGSATADTGTLTVVGSVGGQTYSVSYTAEAGGTITGADTPTVDAEGTDMQIGVALVKTGLGADGVTPLVRPCQPGDSADSIIGFVASQNTAIKAIDPDTGYTAMYIRSGRTVAYIPINGGHAQWSVTSEKAVTDGARVWVRTTASASEIAGATTDVPDVDPQVITVTPTAADTTVYSGFVSVQDLDGLTVANVPFYYLSTADPATATQISTGVQADITTPLTGFAAVSGTDTVILTMATGYTASFVPTGPGILSPVASGGTSDHVVLPKPLKFSRTSRAGIAVIQF